MIRIATKEDIPRLSEILVFAKRAAYRSIFQNDFVSFNVITVFNVAKDFETERKIDNIFVFVEDEIIKGLLTFEVEDKKFIIKELYIDPFFQKEGIGSQLLNYAKTYAKTEKMAEIFLWVLEKNSFAIDFYKGKGLIPTGDRKEFATTGQYIVGYSLRLN